MKILLTNDDGIHAKGLEALYEAMVGLGDIYVVAPNLEMSATAHSITMTQPLRITEVKRNGSAWGWGVNGTPSDAAKLALNALLPELPDVVISGINQGFNTGMAAIYSGTVAAASEGTFLGIPSLAVSLASKHFDDFQPAARVTRHLVEHLSKKKLEIPRFTLLNVNVPPIPLEAMKGFRLMRQGMAGFRDVYEKRIDPRGKEYYWLDGSGFLKEEAEDTDDYGIKEGYVTITPLRYDLTDYEFLESAGSWLTDINLQGEDSLRHKKNS
jgi:5'-nucleotidase